MKSANDDNFEDVLTQLTASEKMLLAELEGFDLNYAHPKGGWSAGQVLSHLIKTERYFHPLFWVAPALGTVPVVLACLDKANVLLCKMAGLKFIANGEAQPRGLTSLTPDFKGRFVAPRFLRPGNDSFDRETLLATRASVREKTLAHMRRIGRERLQTLRFSHPELGPLTLLEMILFISKHEAWHTLQLKRLKEQMH